MSPCWDILALTECCGAGGDGCLMKYCERGQDHFCFPCQVLQQEICSSAVAPPQRLSWAAGGHSWRAALNVSVLLLCCCFLPDCMCLWAQRRCEERAHVWPTSQRLWTSKLGLLLWCDLTCALGEIVQPLAVPHFMFCKMVHNLTSQGFYR